MVRQFMNSILQCEAIRYNKMCAIEISQNVNKTNFHIMGRQTNKYFIDYNTSPIRLIAIVIKYIIQFGL